jgi:hypothetical protein
VTEIEREKEAGKLTSTHIHDLMRYLTRSTRGGEETLKAGRNRRTSSCDDSWNFWSIMIVLCTSLYFVTLRLFYQQPSSVRGAVSSSQAPTKNHLNLHHEEAFCERSTGCTHMVIMIPLTRLIIQRLKPRSQLAASRTYRQYTFRKL